MTAAKTAKPKVKKDRWQPSAAPGATDYQVIRFTCDYGKGDQWFAA